FDVPLRTGGHALVGQCRFLALLPSYWIKFDFGLGSAFDRSTPKTLYFVARDYWPRCIQHRPPQSAIVVQSFVSVVSCGSYCKRATPTAKQAFSTGRGVGRHFKLFERRIADFAAKGEAGLPPAAMTETWRRTNSAANVGNREI